MIPRILHRIWLDDPMPAEFARYGVGWRRLHPEWRHIDWTRTNELPRLINQDLFDRAPQIVPKDWKRFRADLLRLELLWIYGGVYIDTDVEPLRPIDEPLDGVECFAAWSPNRGPRGERLLTQAVMGATPEHPFIGECIRRAPEAVERYQGRPLAQVVGPWHVTRVYEDAVAKESDQRVTVFPERYFYPQSNAERDAGAKPDLTHAYGWHQWANTKYRRRGGVEQGTTRKGTR